MRYEQETHDRHPRRHGAGRWEPADDGESRRWHDHHHHDDDDDERGPRGRGRARLRGAAFGPDPRFFAGGPGFPGGPGFGGPGMHGLGPWLKEGRGGRGSRARRGDVRAAALALLAEQPMNGYQIIQEIGERSGGVWRPSPGSVYPALQQLEDEGLIRAEAGDGGRRAYQLTDEGRSYVDSRADELRAPWDEVTGGTAGPAFEMRSLIAQLAMAAFQVISAGSDAQVAQARQLLTDTRKALYRILAADEDDAAGSGSSSGGE
jgi:DNA-binding PadR family transcriptional regulator